MFVPPELARCHADLYASARDAGDLLTRCRAALLVAPAGAYISHHTAGQLRGLWVPDSPRIHLSVLPGRNRDLAVPELAVHRGRADALVRPFAGIRVAHPVEVVIELSVQLWLPELVALTDSVVRQTCTVPELTAFARERRPGLRRLRRALELSDARSESAQESRVRVLIGVAELPRPVPQYLEIHPVTKAVYRIDLAYPQWRIAIEYDGAHHVQDPEQKRADGVRREALRLLGWTVIVVTSQDLFNAPGSVLARIAQAINDRADAAPRISSAWRDHFAEHASRLWDFGPKAP